MNLNKVIFDKHGVAIDGTHISAIRGMKVDSDIDETGEFSEITIKFIGGIEGLDFNDKMPDFVRKES